MDLSKSVEVEVDLSFFKARPYQEDFFNAIDEGWTRIFYLAARRTGKDYAAWYWCIEEACLNGPVFILYCLPTYTLARAVIFEGRDLDGRRFIDMIPKAAVESINISTMRITFKNGSMIWLVGANDFKTRLVGINPSIMIFSEWARFEDGGSAWDFASPILAAHGKKGRAIFLTTPYGKNFAFHMWEMAQTLKDWKCIKKSIEDCGHISQEEIEKERAMKTPELFAQEFLCSFSRGVEGAVFSRELNKIRDNGQITTIEYSAEHEVNVAIDIGMRDATTMVFFQVIGAGSIIRVIDCESFTGEGLTKLAALIQSKPYKYNKFFAPHDLEVREWTRGGVTRKQLAAQMGLEFHVLPKLSKLDQIEIARVAFPKLWIDSRKCARLVDAMENYHREWDDKLQTYKGNPVHNWASDLCDSFIYMCQSLDLCQRGMTAEQFNEIRNKALRGSMLNPIPYNIRNPF